MANRNSDDFYDLLRARGLRKKVAKSIAALEGNSRRAGASGERLARQTVEDLTAAVDDIRKRVLRRDRGRSQAAKKAAGTRRRTATQRSASARKAAQTRAKAQRTRAKASSAAR
jgi:hypothetical protein